MLVEVISRSKMEVDVDENEVFRILCKTLCMDFVLDEDKKFYVNKQDGCVWETVGRRDRCIDDRGSMFIALRNVAVNMFPNVYFRSDEYIWNYPWKEQEQK